MGTIILGLKILISILVLGFTLCIALLIFSFLRFFLQRNKRIESSESNVDCSGNN